MKTISKIALLFSIAFGLTACSTQEVDDKGAELLVSDFLQAVHQGEYDQAFAMASPEFFGVRSPQEWKNRFAEVRTKLGQLETLKLKQKLSDVRLSGHFYIYQFANKYEKGLAKEMVTIVQKVNSNEPLKISSYKIESSKISR